MSTPLQIEAGKFYRTRDGKMARIYATDGSGSYPVHGAVLEGVGWGSATWTYSGVFDDGVETGEHDIISEWRDDPVVDWSKYPEWMPLLAMDEDRRWFLFECEPSVTLRRWESAGDALLIPPEYAPKFTGDWKDSLAKRP
jgi:hypothetical protein